MDVFRAYAYATATYLTLQSLPLLLAPRAILLLTTTPETLHPTTDVEAHLSRGLGLALLALAVLVLLLTGAIPLKEDPNSSSSRSNDGNTSPSYPTSSSSNSIYPSSSAAASASTLSLVTFEDDEADRLANPYVQATLVITTTYHACTAFHLYSRLNVSLAPSTFALGTGWLTSAVLGGVGVWVLVFGGERARVSRTTGADKRTANYPFENKESAREKKKEKLGRKSILRTKSR